MFSKLREPFGKAGLIVAVVALVLALGGGAWALSASTGGKHHAKDYARAKAKSHARGVRGPQGPAGPEGPEGPAGVNGKNGTNGRNGVDGTNGLPGRSVVSGIEPVGENCEQGGYWFEIQGSGSKQYVCNGSGGGGGSGGTELAPGDTETGVWVISGTNETAYYLSISFPLRLPEHEELDSIDPNSCPGSAEHPEAGRGAFCLYIARAINAGYSGAALSPDSRSGIITAFNPVDPTEPSFARGTWAATARCPINPETGEEEESC